MDNRKKRCSANNKGYSVVEMVIVIAIIVILSAVGFLTINIVYGAKVSSAKNTLNSQMSYLSNMTKAQDPGLAAWLYYDDTADVYKIKYGIYVSSGGGGYSFTANASQDPVTFSDSILIYYTDDAGNKDVIGTAGRFIQFNKSDGAVLVGSGTYDIIKNPRHVHPDNASGNEAVATSIVLNKSTGSHFAK